ncbi:MAG: NAD(P)-dependent oxidoreductase [Planctomycetota bacterium]
MSNESSDSFPHVLITGGAGYVGSVLTPQLLEAGHRVTVLDLCWYGDDVLPNHENLTLIQGDLRDADTVKQAMQGVDAVIHLACVSNDPSFDLDPELGKSINLDAFEPLVDAAVEASVQRFVYASSSSVYGVSDEPDVTEDHPLNPLTDYSRFKAQCEPILLGKATDKFVPVVIRPATVCGYGPRQRLDVIVNILTNHAVHNQKIRVFGGDQLRPNLHINDMADCYEAVLAADDATVASKVWNVGSTNHPVSEIASIVKRVVEQEMPELGEIVIGIEPTDDPRSYHVNSSKVAAELGFEPALTIEDAVRDLCFAFKAGKLPESMSDPKYFNVKVMSEQPATV